MARFGAPYLDEVPARSFDARRVASALLVPWWRQPASGPSPMRTRLVLDDVAGDSVDLCADERTVRVVAVEPELRPDVVVSTTVAQLVAARQGDGAFAGAVAGSAPARRTFLEAFDLEPVAS
jgi:hypothetical protein